MPSKLVLVTGASSGIGEATAKRYAARGARVLLLARNPERLDAVAAALRHGGGTARAYPVDLANPDAISQVSVQIERDDGVPDVLINNAGAGRWLSLAETTAEEALAMIEVPYLAAFNLTRAFLPAMRARGSGAIACITSPASFVTWPHAAGYIAARRALKGFTDTLRVEVRKTGLTVTLVVLGLVESGYWDHNPGSRQYLAAPKPLAPPMSPEEAAEAIFTGVERGRRMVVKPAILRALLLLSAMAPDLATRLLRPAKRQPSH
jgi:short-subunit dehydrogenase